MDPFSKFLNLDFESNFEIKEAWKNIDFDAECVDNNSKIEDSHFYSHSEGRKLLTCTDCEHYMQNILGDKAWRQLETR